MANTVSSRSVKSSKPAAPQATKKSARLSNSQQEQVAKLAYQFWVERNYQHGYDQDDWARAESVVRARTAS